MAYLADPKKIDTVEASFGSLWERVEAYKRNGFIMEFVEAVFRKNGVQNRTVKVRRDALCIERALNRRSYYPHILGDMAAGEYNTIPDCTEPQHRAEWDTWDRKMLDCISRGLDRDYIQERSQTLFLGVWTKKMEAEALKVMRYWYHNIISTMRFENKSAQAVMDHIYMEYGNTFA